MQILKHKTNIDFIGKRKPALFISSVLNLAILVGIAIFGFNFGVDFAGGTVVELEVRAPHPRRRGACPGPGVGAARRERAGHRLVQPRTATSSGWAA